MRYQTQGVHFHQLPVQQQKWVLLRKNPFFNRWFVPADCLPTETPKQAHIQKTAQRKQSLWSRIKNKIKGVFNGW